MQELEAAQQVVLAQEVDRLDHLARRQAELRPVAARRLPAPRALGRQLDADADARPHAHLLRGLGDQRQLGELLDDDQHRAPQLRRHERGLDVLLVLVAVADDQRFFVVEHAHDRQQLRLRAGLEPVVVGPPELDDLLDDVAVLVDLDRVDALVLALVAVLGDGAAEGLVQLDDAALEHVREADQQRQADAAPRHLVDQLLEVDLAVLDAAGVRLDVPGVVDGEVVVTPSLDAVDLRRVGDCPLLGDPSGAAHRRVRCRKSARDARGNLRRRRAGPEGACSRGPART